MFQSMKSKTFNQAVKRLQRAFTKSHCVGETLHSLRQSGNHDLAEQVDEHFMRNPSIGVLDRHRASEVLSQALFSQGYNVTSANMKSRGEAYFLDGKDLLPSLSGTMEKLDVLAYSCTPQAKNRKASILSQFKSFVSAKASSSTLVFTSKDILIGSLKSKADFWRMIDDMLNVEGVEVEFITGQMDDDRYEPELNFYLPKNPLNESDDFVESVSIKWSIFMGEYGEEYESVSLSVNDDDAYDFSDTDNFDDFNVDDDVLALIQDRDFVDVGVDRDLCMVSASQEKRVKVLFDELIDIVN